MGGGGQKDGNAAAIPVEDALGFLFRPPVTPEQTDAWFQPPAASPSELPDPPPYQQPQFARNLGRAVAEVGPELQGMVQAPVEFAKKAADPNLSVPSRLAAAVGAVASASQVDPLLPHSGQIAKPTVFLPDYMSSGGGWVEKPAVHIRFGDLPEGVSGKYMEGQRVGDEPGVSVVGAWHDPKTGKYVVRTTGTEDQEGIQGINRNAYLVEGQPMKGLGSDEEPLLHAGTVKVIKQIPLHDITTIDNPNLTFGGTELAPHETPDWMAPELPPPVPKIPAGAGFVWGAKPIENIQGLPKSGVMPESRFAKAGSESGQFSNDELALMKQVVPDAFTQSGVDVPKLHEGLAQSGPVVEVKKLGSIETTPEHQKLAQITHELDTRYPNWRQTNIEHAQGEMQGLMDQERTLDQQVNMMIYSGGTSAQYKFVGPKPENQMPGYVEGLVRLPLKTDYVGRRDAPAGTYVGSHFGPEDKNVLSSYRGYEETLPNGEKAFHVIEVQSDWGQQARKDLADRQGAGETPLRQITTPTADHPLLPHYETLGLKAAIQHAKEIGLNQVFLPDAETAMMTEGHDKQVRPEIIDSKDMGPRNEGLEELQVQYPSPRYSIQPEGGKFNIYDNEKLARPSQEGGMRLHYDQTLPSAMRKLTGDKGTPVDLGTHKGAERQGPYADTPEGLRSLQEITGGVPMRTPDGKWRLGGSPVFKDAAGNPKTNITGKIYDISKTPDQFKLMKAGDKFSAAKYLPA